MCINYCGSNEPKEITACPRAVPGLARTDRTWVRRGGKLIIFSALAATTLGMAAGTASAIPDDGNRSAEPDPEPSREEKPASTNQASSPSRHTSDDDGPQVTFSETFTTEPVQSVPSDESTVPPPTERLTNDGSRGPGTYLDLDVVLGITESEVGDDGSLERLTVINDQSGGRFQIEIAEDGSVANTLTIPPINSEDEDNGGGRQITWNTNPAANTEGNPVEPPPNDQLSATVENPTLDEDDATTEDRVPGVYFDWDEETGTLTRTILEEDGTLTIGWTDPATGEFHETSIEPPVQPDVVEPIRTPDMTKKPPPKTATPSVTTRDGEGVSTGSGELLRLNQQNSGFEQFAPSPDSDEEESDRQRTEPATAEPATANEPTAKPATATADRPIVEPATADEATRKASCIDSDGDGWGWTGSESCQAPKSQCIDSDGDGWGWTGIASCRMTTPARVG